ncbi:MAG: hypothetical protein ACTHN5_02275 [Phycisphaerae bacterium]
MVQNADPITFSVPRAVLSDIARLTQNFNDRMHELLERNTDGTLTPQESAELQSLVRMAEFGQIVDAALQTPSAP